MKQYFYAISCCSIPAIGEIETEVGGGEGGVGGGGGGEGGGEGRGGEGRGGEGRGGGGEGEERGRGGGGEGGGDITAFSKLQSLLGLTNKAAKDLMTRACGQAIKGFSV